MLSEATFARRTLRIYQIYAQLAESEKVPEFKAILTDLADTSKDQFDFWARKSGVRGDDANVPHLELWMFQLMRWVFGIAFTARFIVGRKERRIALYKQYCATCTVDTDARTIEVFVERLHAITARLNQVSGR